MKKVLALLLTLAICFSFVSCGEKNNDSSSTEESEATEQSGLDPSSDDISQTSGSDEGDSSANDNSQIDESQDDTSDFELTPLLYKVSDENGNYVWIFGSIHVGDESFYPLPEYVIENFNKSNFLAVEFDVVAFQTDTEAMQSALSTMIYRDGTTIKDHISEETYTAARAILIENNVYSAFLDFYMPCFWESTISSLLYEKLGVDTTEGIDVHLINKADSMKKRIMDVESAEFQYGMMAGFSDELQNILLEQAIESYNSGTGLIELELLKDAWAKGDETALAATVLGDEEISEKEKELYNEYIKAMITDRNIGMADFVENILPTRKKVFMCVGVGHVVGEGGIVDLLSERGYTVERVTA